MYSKSFIFVKHKRANALSILRELWGGKTENVPVWGGALGSHASSTQEIVAAALASKAKWHQGIRQGGEAYYPATPSPIFRDVGAVGVFSPILSLRSIFLLCDERLCDHFRDAWFGIGLSFP